MLLSMAIQQFFPFFMTNPHRPHHSDFARNLFPDVEKIFREAYGLSDPTPVLLKLTAYPTVAA